MFSTEKCNIDARNEILGRLASNISVILKKYSRRPLACNRSIVSVSGARNVKLTGRKLYQKVYFRHTGFPGGLKCTEVSQLFKTKPDKILMKAIGGMMPKNRLSRRVLKLIQIT